MKFIFITGVNRGIGFFLAKELLSAGNYVIGTYRQTSERTNVKLLKKNFPKTFNAILLDVIKVDNETFTEALKSFKSIDIVINNAGVLDNGDQKFNKLRISDIFHSFEVNTIGPMKLTQYLLPKLSKSPDPKIFHITSQMGSITDNLSGGYYYYRISKAALNMFNKSFSIDHPNITSIVLHPGWVRTDMGGSNAPLLPEDSASMLAKLVLRLDRSSSGEFLNYMGNTLPW